MGGTEQHTAQKSSGVFTALKFDEERREATGVLAKAFDGSGASLDTDGEAMKAVDVFKLARSYMLTGKTAGHDDSHSKVPGNRTLVEMFVNDDRIASPLYPPGAAVCTMKYHDDADWQAVKAGQRNGFSFDAAVVPVIEEVEVLVPAEEVRAA